MTTHRRMLTNLQDTEMTTHRRMLTTTTDMQDTLNVPL